MEELDSFEILIIIYENTWCDNPGGHSHDFHCKTENLSSHLPVFFPEIRDYISHQCRANSNITVFYGLTLNVLEDR
jgi:hypothetical protein